MNVRRRDATCAAVALATGLVVAVSAACGESQPRTPEQEGASLARSKGCVSCHTTDGRTAVGPTFKGLHGREVVLEDGTTVVADDAYLRESILHPSRRTVKGFDAGVMESVVREGSITRAEADALVAYIRTLR